MRKPRKEARVVIGVTGSVGTGKSTVAQMFVALGARLIDADDLAHKAMLPGSPVYTGVVRCFGRGILGTDATIDRRRLGALVFDDTSMRARLNALVHKEVIRVIRKKLAGYTRGAIVLDAPLLIEAGLRARVDILVVVKTSRTIQCARLRKKTGLGTLEILKRIKAQMPISSKISFGDFIIDNSGRRSRTKRQAEKIWKKVVVNRHNGGS